MSNNIQRSQGRGSSYKFDRGGTPTEFGPYIGVVKNNIDPTRSGRLQVYIKQFGGDNPNDKSLWRTVSYIPPFYGITPRNNSTTTNGNGNFLGNPHTYGMWFTPPDLGVNVICFFVAGDPDQGYYIGCVPETGVSHMIPAVGASKNFLAQNASQTSLAEGAKATQLPVVESNFYNKSTEIDPKFWDLPKPVHSYVFAILANQGLLGDNIRGPITSNSQRETPSAACGIITPGRAVYQGGLTEKDIKKKIADGSIKLADVKIEGRRGGHSLVMDDGDLEGRDNLIRIRTANGHQITMSDDGNCFYFVHANGQTWIEMGKEGTVDVYSANSINLRTQGTLNLHADKDVNINAGEQFNVRANSIKFESKNEFSISAAKDITVYSESQIGVLSDGTLTVKSDGGSWDAGSSLVLKASRIDLNGGSPAGSVEKPAEIKSYKLDDTTFNSSSGWTVETGKIETIVTRAPTHEPYPYHGKGVPVSVSYSGGGSGGGDELGGAGAEDVNRAIAGTENLPVQNPVDAASVLDTPAAADPIGTLDQAQVTGLIAQARTAVGQAAGIATPSKGIGQFGFKPEQLEAAGILKPGTANMLAKTIPGTPTAADIAEAGRSGLTPTEVAKNRIILGKLASPQLWTGKNGIAGLSSLLSNDRAQNAIQQTLMSTAFNGLKSSGIAKGTESAEQLGSLVQSATKYGVAGTESWVKGVTQGPAAQAIANTVKSAQYAVNFVTTKISSFFGGGTLFGGGGDNPVASNTVDRSAVDSSVSSAIGNAKVPKPNFKDDGTNTNSSA